MRSISNGNGERAKTGDCQFSPIRLMTASKAAAARTAAARNRDLPRPRYGLRRLLSSIT